MRGSDAINGLNGRRSTPRKPQARLIGWSVAPIDISVNDLIAIGIGLGISRVSRNHCGLDGGGSRPGALDSTCASPCGNITTSPADSRTGGSPAIAAQP